MKYALVTGGSGGIGSAICLRLSLMDYKILIHYNSNITSANNTLDQIKANGGSGELIQFDVTDIKDVNNKLSEWKEAHPDEYIQDVSKMTDNELAEVRNREIGFIFQTFNLLPRSTALENVMLPLVYAGIGKSERVKRAEATLDDVQLSDRMSHRPNELSGGQRQRVAVARALVNKPSIVLADEPTGNLDSKTSLEILGLLEEIHKLGNTIIVVTHEEDIAQHAHRIIRMLDGYIASDEINKDIKTIKDYNLSEVE